MKVYRDLYFHLCALYNIWQIVKEKCTKTLFLNKWVQSHSLCFKDTVQSKGDGFIWFDTFCLLAVKTQVEKKEFCSQNPTVADGWRAAELVNSLVMKVWWDPISLISSSENQKIYIYMCFPQNCRAELSHWLFLPHWPLSSHTQSADLANWTGPHASWCTWGTSTRKTRVWSTEIIWCSWMWGDKGCL